MTPSFPALSTKNNDGTYTCSLPGFPDISHTDLDESSAFYSVGEKLYYRLLENWVASGEKEWTQPNWDIPDSSHNNNINFPMLAEHYPDTADC